MENKTCNCANGCAEKKLNLAINDINRLLRGDYKTICEFCANVTNDRCFGITVDEKGQFKCNGAIWRGVSD